MDPFFIEYLNKDKGFLIDRIYFKTYNEAILWAKSNLSNFNTDIIKQS